MKRIVLLLLLSLTACQSQTGEEPAKTVATAPVKTAEPDTRARPERAPAVASAEPQKLEAAQQPPPAPPVSEDFQAQPQLSLFPRAGAFRPEDNDAEGLQFWRTYIDHLMRTSGPLKPGGEKDPDIAFGFRAIKGLESVGLFSPLAVKPDTTYEVGARISCDLNANASAGIGVLEFDKFLWIGEQYPESLAKKHQVGSRQLRKLSGKLENSKQRATFTTGPKTAMIHLVFFRDGEQDRNPVVIDDIEIMETGVQGTPTTSPQPADRSQQGPARF